MRKLPLVSLFGVVLVAVVPATSSSAPIDPAARGLDAFIHVGSSAAAGSTLTLDLETFGFAQVTEATPLAGASIDLVWDPEHLGKGVSVAPPAVSVTSDATGHAVARVPVPTVGSADDLLLLVQLRHGSHARSRELNIKRTWPTKIELHVADPRVVPGDDISAWATVTDTSTGQPVPNAAVRVSLLESGFARTALQATTDAAGAVMVRMPIPPLDDPSVEWVLAGDLDRAERGPHSEIALTLRDETPGAPSLDARFDASNIDTGKKAAFTLRLRDGSLDPIAGQNVRYWSGPSGTTAPGNDDAWLAGSIATKTDANGEVHADVTAPTIVRGGTSAIQLVARAAIEGHELRATGLIGVGAPTESVTLLPEAHVLVPGLDQRLLLRVRDPHDQGIAGAFEIVGDGLSTTATTDANGEAEIHWRAPDLVGAARQVGPCAGGVAATVTIRPTTKMTALGNRTDPFSVCVGVDRDTSSIVSLDRTIVHVGERVHVSVTQNKPSKEAISVVLVRERAVVSAWIDPEKGGDIELPEAAAGVWQVTTAAPRSRAHALLAQSALLVLPRALPRLDAKLVASRLAPGGTAEIDALLTDDTGKPITGTVASVIVDLSGGGSVAGIRELDTRTSLCSELGESTRCDAMLRTTADGDAVRRAALGAHIDAPLSPVTDPGGSAKQDLDQAFGAMLRSLEGAVYDSSKSPDSLRDVRRHTARGWEFNPELLTLTTAAMDSVPRTPGGEELSLGDLLAIDRQVTYDNVARRVTRLKLLQLLVNVRNMKHERRLDDTDPIWTDPNALLRRMVASSTITSDALLDPWGSTLVFTRAARASSPFLGIVPGWELRSAGPNGVLGDGDDLSDPFVRVLASNTPYARALGEDQIVDAKWDMEVSEPTISAWQTLLESFTGTTLGGIGGQGSGSGGGGGGAGHGTHSSKLRNSGTTLSQRRPALWTPPIRTDAQGHVHLSIKLDTLETTWGIGLVALPDHAPPATAVVELPVALPLSARVDAGVRWVEGDTVAVRVTLRNRTATVAHGKLTLEAKGVARLLDAGEASRDVEVPAFGAIVVNATVSAPRAGDAQLVANLDAQGVGSDTLTESWEVKLAGVRQNRVESTWVTKEDVFELTPLVGESLTGSPSLTLERGFGGTLEDAMTALDPDVLHGVDALTACVEVSSRVKRWAQSQPDRAALVARAEILQARATARLSHELGPKAVDSVATAALRVYGAARPDAPAASKTNDDTCLASATRDDVEVLDAEPAPRAGSSLPCWDTFATDAVAAARESLDPSRLATAVLALADRPHRAALMTSAIAALRDKVSLQPDGSIRLKNGRRSDRVIVMAALVRAASLGVVLPATEERLVGWLSVDRDARGGFGSPAATRAVVRALIGSRLGVAQPSRAVVTVGDRRIDVAVPAQGRVVVPLDANVTRVTVHNDASPVLVRFSRPLLRSFAHPPDALASSMHLEVAWPSTLRAAAVSTLHVTAKSSTSVYAVIRIPLPAGATLAEASGDVRQIQGTLLIRSTLSPSDSAWDIPIRFALRGEMTAPEAHATSDRDVDDSAIAPASKLVVR